MSEDKCKIINSLVEQKAESRTLDYKEEMALSTDSEKKEIAKDIAAFANSEGGHILVGVRDGTWEPIGIDPSSIDLTKVHQIAASRPRPPVSVDAELIQCQGVHFALLTVKRSDSLHQVDGRYPIRRGSITDYASDPEVTRMRFEKTEEMYKAFSRAAFHEPSIAEYLTLEAGRMPQQQVDQLKKVLDYYVRRVVGFSVLDRFSRRRRERRFLTAKYYEEVCKSVMDACHIILGKETLSISRKFLDVLALRAFGLIIAAAFAWPEDSTRVDISDYPAVRITLEIEPSKFIPRWEGQQHFAKQTFFEWARNYAGFEEQPLDRELYDALGSLGFEEMNRWLSEKHQDPISGQARLFTLLSLQTEMYRKWIEAIQQAEEDIFSVLAKLTVESSPDLFRIIQGRRKSAAIREQSL